MSSLSLLGDMSSYIQHKPTSNINNTAILAVGPRLIYCSGVILAARSPVLKKMLEKDNEVYLTEFVNVIDSVYTCLKLLYGGTIAITADNAKVIYKFGTHYDIQEMQEIACKWIKDDLTLAPFWETFIQFQNYHDATIDMFGECAVRLMEADTELFLTAMEDMLKSCTETREVKNIVHFILTKLYSLSDMVPIILRLLIVPGEDCFTPAIKETCAEALLAGLEHVFVENSDSVVSLSNIGDVLQCLEDVLDKKMSCIKRLSVLQRSLLVKLKENEAASVYRTLTVETNEAAGSSGTQSADWLNKDYIHSLTKASQSMEGIIKFVDARSVEPCIIVEVVLKWLQNNTSTPETSRRLLADSVVQVPEWYYRQFIHFYDIADKVHGLNFEHDNSVYEMYGWNVMGADVDRLFGGGRISLTGCWNTTFLHTASFKYKRNCVPAYDLTNRDICRDSQHYGTPIRDPQIIGEIVHWYMVYLKRTDRNESLFSYITNTDNCGTLKKYVPRKIVLYCLYRSV